MEYDLSDSTNSQREVVNYVRDCIKSGKRALVYNSGGVRAGKSYGAVIALIEHLLSRKQSADYMILAYTAQLATTVFAPIITRVIDTFDIEDLTLKLYRGLANPRAVIKFEGREFNIYFRAAGSEGDDRSIQGLTLSGLIVDELTNLKRDVVAQAECRVSDPGGLRILTMNKTSQYFWGVKYYSDRITNGQLKGLVVDSFIEDNQHIEQDYITERRTEFSGKQLDRFLNNKFTSNSEPKIQLTTLPRSQLTKERRKLCLVWVNDYGAILYIYLFHNRPLEYVITDCSVSMPYDQTEPLKRDTQYFISPGLALRYKQLRSNEYKVRMVPEDYPYRELSLLLLQSLTNYGYVKILEPHSATEDNLSRLMEQIDSYGINDSHYNAPDFVRCLGLINPIAFQNKEIRNKLCY